ncbi:MAG: putative peptidoglycan endopeptidase LytE [Opitutia bacterium UBA7350]|nr:MAG: putative peptidoglycan endopeptidase LytE [Opitutae bacterium UBA7350]
MPCSRREFTRHALLTATASTALLTGAFAAGSGIHTVKRGDTLSGLAQRYGTSVSALKRSNHLSSDLIQVGQTLIIPAQAASQFDPLRTVRTETARIRVKRSNWKAIIAHHSAIKKGNAESYGRTHRKKGMKNGLAYHFVIGNGIDSGDGQIEVGPRWTGQLQGGHVKNHQLNLVAIGICLVGNFEIERPTRKQLQSFTLLVDWLQRSVLRRTVRFAGHREIKGEQTLCPGKNFPLASMHRRYG